MTAKLNRAEIASGSAAAVLSVCLGYVLWTHLPGHPQPPAAAGQATPPTSSAPPQARQQASRHGQPGRGHIIDVDYPVSTPEAGPTPAGSTSGPGGSTGRAHNPAPGASSSPAPTPATDPSPTPPTTSPSPSPSVVPAAKVCATVLVVSTCVEIHPGG